MNLLPKPVRIIVEALAVAGYILVIMGAILILGGAFNLL